MADHLIHGFDAYELVPALLAFVSGLALLARAGRRPATAGSRRPRVDELLLCVAGLSLAILLLHQVVTDGVCHGSCAFSMRGGR